MATVNYIVERESFIRHARDNGYTGNEQLLWYALFTIFNERANRNMQVWPDGFIRISNKELLSWLPFGENTLIQTRGSLVNPSKHQPLLVEYIKGKRNADMPQYKMHWFSMENDSGYLNSSGNTGGNVRGNTTGNTRDINIKLNKTRLEEKSEKKLYYNSAWRTDARARKAVAQNILDLFADNCEGLSPRATEDVCYYLELGMTPEEVSNALFGIQNFRYVGNFLHTAAVNMGLTTESEDAYV